MSSAGKQPVVPTWLASPVAKCLKYLFKSWNPQLLNPLAVPSVIYTQAGTISPKSRAIKS